MSGKPNPKQTQELRECATNVRNHDHEIARLSSVIADSEARLKETSAARNRNAARIVELLNMMDCTPGGNYGSEGRVVWLLSELVEQTAINARANP